MATRLTPRQEAFCRLYLELGNAAEAYRQVYPRSKVWKAETLHPHVSKLLANYKVATRIEELKAQKEAEYRAEAERQGITPADVVREQAYTAFFDPADLFDGSAIPLPIEKLAEPTRRAVKTLKRRVDKDGHLVLFEYQAHDKLTALRHLGEHLGMYREPPANPWLERLQHMTEEELEEEQRRAEQDLQDALRERERKTRSG